jgi:sugar phosphate isomerase/epimerase
MKTGYRTSPYSKLDILNALHKIAEAGYDGVELCLENPDCRVDQLDASAISRIKDGLAENRLGLASLSWHGNYLVDEKVFAGLRKAIPITRRMDCDILILSTGPIKDKPAQWKALVARTKELLKIAEGHQVTLAMEPEPNFVCETTDDGIRLAEETGSPRMAVNLDIGHAHITDTSIADSIKKLGGLLVHTHIEDIKDKVHKHLPPWEGDIDFRAVARALQEARYDGYLVADLFASDPAVVAKPTRAFLQGFCILDLIHKIQEDLAQVHKRLKK